MRKKVVEKAQREKAERKPLDGWLILDKPQNLTSTAALGAVKRLLSATKGGHSGTLDPLATGVLPLAFGQATKTIPWVQESEKTYRFSVAWGAETDTDDSEGKVVGESAERPSIIEIEEALNAFRGVVRQVPPTFSALKVNGVRAYDIARGRKTQNKKTGEEKLVLPAREVSIFAFDLLAGQESQAEFMVRCGSGTYVRALARDLGRTLGCLGHVVALRRTAVGAFGEEDAISLEDLAELADNDSATTALLPIAAGLTALPRLTLDRAASSRLASGQAVELVSRQRAGLVEEAGGLEEGATIAVFAGGQGRGGQGGTQLLAIATQAHGILKPLKVFAPATPAGLTGGAGCGTTRAEQTTEIRTERKQQGNEPS